MSHLWRRKVLDPTNLWKAHSKNIHFRLTLRNTWKQNLPSSLLLPHSVTKDLFVAMESFHCRRHPPYKNQRGKDAQLHLLFYHHSVANCGLILPTSPFLPWFNWTWFIFQLTSFNPFPTKKANPLWVTSSAAHHPGSEAEREGTCGSLSPDPGWWWGWAQQMQSWTTSLSSSFGSLQSC